MYIKSDCGHIFLYDCSHGSHSLRYLHYLFVYYTHLYIFCTLDTPKIWLHFYLLHPKLLFLHFGYTCKLVSFFPVTPKVTFPPFWVHLQTNFIFSGYTQSFFFFILGTPINKNHFSCYTQKHKKSNLDTSFTKKSLSLKFIYAQHNHT